MKEYKYRLFYMEPPIDIDKIPEKFEFEGSSFEWAYQHSKTWIKENKIEGTIILMVAQLDR